MGELLLLALFIPLVTGLLSMFQDKVVIIKSLNLVGSSMTSSVLAFIVFRISTQGAFLNGLLYVDSLSAVLLTVVAVLSLTSMVFSMSYMEKELVEGHITIKMLKRYYGLFNVFIFTMISVLVVENLGLMWVAVEATTLASALLVAFYFNQSALEAAWKYVMVCTVGICLALLGTILLYYAQVNVVGINVQALSWLELKTIASKLDPTITKLAFIFILIGYGTKAGLAPMHTWLPDAHSQAPSPISGLLSGALLSCAIYAIVRNLIVVQAILNHEFLQYLLIGLALFSIGIAIPFILVQHDIKRLLAYSSVEHMGIVLLGIGISTPLAIYGALLHVINHAIAKSALFYLAGIITQEYKTKYIMRIRGLIRTMPLVGTLFIISILAITGTPPFSLFISKFTIIWASFNDGRFWLGAGVLFLLAGIFAGMMYYCLEMVFGNPGHNISVGKVGKPALWSIVFSIGVMIVTGLYVPLWLHTLLIKAASVVMGGD
ncbi:hydrogenase 4 subunit F [Pelosinus sp. UFO1]|uniref:hydrogenase 4 subunit F n=1 Tax=Pelosinus sp. UFO1 TaxID=484770 RepID=UPI00056F430D|nr:hydrogenase 4 subunit F [Pelosinus sp. UFO1]